MKLSTLIIFVLFSIQGFAHTSRTMTSVRVIDREGRLGTVIKNLGNGQVQVRFDRNLRGEETFSTARLSPAVDRTERFQIGDRVLTSSDQTGTVRELFLNGKAEVRVDGVGGKVFEQKDLFSSVARVKGFRVNQIVANAAGNRGRILELFENGKADVHFDTMVGGYIRDISELRSGEIQVGDSVIDNNGHIGVVLKVYEIGAAKVNYDFEFGGQAVSVANLSRAVKSLGSLKVGDEVSIAGKQTGIIREIFENGAVDVYVEGHTGVNLVSASKLKNLASNCSDLLRKFSEF